MNQRKCIHCASVRCIKRGSQQGIQRWYCKDCQKVFQANQKSPPVKEELFCLFVFGKRTLAELSEEYHKETKYLQQVFDEVVLPVKIHTPRQVNIAVDTTFFGDFGIMVFRDQKNKENLWWRFVDEERLEYYTEGRLRIEQLGYEIASVTGDGLIGLPNVFKGILFQYCHFHAKKTVTTYLTRKPKTEAGIELVDIMKALKWHTHESFIKAMTAWHTKYEYFLKERTVHPDGKWSYTHRKLRAALRSMMHMSHYLFTYLADKKNIPPTTNTLEGHFSHIKVRVGCHRSICLSRKQKLIELLVLNSCVSYKIGMHEKLW